MEQHRHLVQPASRPELRTLTPQEKRDLRRLAFGHKVERRLWFRASILWRLLYWQWSVSKVARSLDTTTRTVRKWRDRFAHEGMDGLLDRPRSGAPPKFSAPRRCEVIAIACDEPENYGFVGQTTWTYDTLTEAVNRTVRGWKMSRSSVVRTLKQNDLKPHKMRMWLHSPDPAFKEKVNRIVTLYLYPPEDAVVLCVDEKTGMQANERKYATQRPIPGRPGRYEFEYIRHGTQSLLAAFEIRTGKVLAHCGPTRTAQDLRAFLEEVAAAFPEKRIIVIWDNLNIHLDGPSKRWQRFNERHGGRFEFVYTPKHASWVNQIEIFFSILHRRCLRHASFRSREELRETVLAFIDLWNTKIGHPFAWSFRGYPLQARRAA